MSRQVWDGEELYSYDGRFIYIVRRPEVDKVIIADFETGETEVVDDQDFESATPDELAGIV